MTTSAAFRGAGVTRALHAVWAGAADHCEDDRRAAGAGGEARHCELLRRARECAELIDVDRCLALEERGYSAITVDAGSAPELGQKHRLLLAVPSPQEGADADVARGE